MHPLPRKEKRIRHTKKWQKGPHMVKIVPQQERNVAKRRPYSKHIVRIFQWGENKSLRLPPFCGRPCGYHSFAKNYMFVNISQSLKGQTKEDMNISLTSEQSSFHVTILDKDKLR